MKLTKSACVLLFITTFILGGLICPLSSQAADFRRVAVDQPLPSFTIKDLKNKKYSSADLSGHDALLLFWKVSETQMNRDYSLEELLMVQNMYTWYAEEKGLLVYAVYIPWNDDKVTNSETDAILALADKYKLTIPILVDRNLTLFNQFGVNATPSTVIANKAGDIVFTMSSYPWSAEKKLKKTVEELLGVTTAQAKYAKVNPEKEKQVSPGAWQTTRVMSQTIWNQSTAIIFDKYQNDKKFDNPTDVSINSRGQLFIVDTGNNMVHLYQRNGDYEMSLGKKGFGGGKFVLPWGVSIDEQDRIYVADIGQHLIHIFDSYKRFLAVFGGSGKGKGRFNMPFDLDCNRGKIVVADTGNDLIQVIQSGFENQFGRRGRKEGEFTNPTAVTMDNAGMIYVLDTDNNRVQIFDSKGNFVTKFGGSGSGQGEFSRPLGIALDNTGRIFVSDSGNNRLQVFKKDGTFISCYGELGKAPNQFNLPGKLFLDSENNVFVVDTGNNRVIALNNRLFGN